jgi:hypothetical protein
LQLSGEKRPHPVFTETFPGGIMLAKLKKAGIIATIFLGASLAGSAAAVPVTT